MHAEVMLPPTAVPTMPPPASLPQLSFEYECFDEPPLAPAYLPQEFDAAGSLLAQQLLLQFDAEEQDIHDIKVKNTFIDSFMPCSPSLERLRQTKSCPGSRLPSPLPSPLPTPRRESTGGAFGMKSSLKEFETMPSICDAT